ncbi:hypothetical protein ACP0HM_33080 [Escherichia coli]
MVIGDRHSIRLYHLIRRKLVILCSSPNRARWRKGRATSLPGKGQWGWRCAPKTPIFDDDGKVIGVVSIGYR